MVLRDGIAILAGVPCEPGSVPRLADSTAFYAAYRDFAASSERSDRRGRLA
jgi:hypothetical protein